MTIDYATLTDLPDVRKLLYNDAGAVQVYAAIGSFDLDDGVTLLTQEYSAGNGDKEYYITFGKDVKILRDAPGYHYNLMPLVETFIKYPELPGNILCVGDFEYGPLNAAQANLMHRYAIAKARGSGDAENEKVLKFIIDRLRDALERPQHKPQPLPSSKASPT